MLKFFMLCYRLYILFENLSILSGLNVLVLSVANIWLLKFWVGGVNTFRFYYADDPLCWICFIVSYNRMKWPPLDEGEDCIVCGILRFSSLEANLCLKNGPCLGLVDGCSSLVTGSGSSVLSWATDIMFEDLAWTGLPNDWYIFEG